jgi:hypothetical protein
MVFSRRARARHRLFVVIIQHAVLGLFLVLNLFLLLRSIIMVDNDYQYDEKNCRDAEIEPSAHDHVVTPFFDLSGLSAAISVPPAGP